MTATRPAASFFTMFALAACTPAESPKSLSSCVLDQSGRDCDVPIVCESGEEAAAYDAAYDEAIKPAIAEARRTLPQFWAKLDARKAGANGFAVRVRRPTPIGGRDYVWLRVIDRTGASVTLLDDAGLPIRSGEYPKITVPTTDLVDWTYSEGGKRFGDFTTRALLDKICRADAKRLKSMLAPTPLENETR